MSKTSVKPIPKVIWLAGPTGCGKTRAAFEESMARGTVWSSPSSTLQWFDGYDAHTTAIFDDFRASGVNFAYLLRVLDRHPMMVPVKGGYVNWIPSYIYITCPRMPVDEFINH